MPDEDLTPEEFRALMASGRPVQINEGQRPVAVTVAWAGMRVVNGSGGGVLTRPSRTEFTASKVSTLAR